MKKAKTITLLVFLIILLGLSVTAFVLVYNYQHTCNYICQQQGHLGGGACRVDKQQPLDADIGAESCDKSGESCMCVVTCNDLCLAQRSTTGRCGAEVGEMMGNRYCEGTTQCVCEPQKCESNDDCKKFNIHSICSNGGCIPPGCSYACREIYGFKDFRRFKET